MFCPNTITIQTTLRIDLYRDICYEYTLGGEQKMSSYDIEISRLLKESRNGTIKTEIWTEITDKETCKTITKRIWWQDDEGVYHDETPTLPFDVRQDVDNAWIEKSRKW